MSKKRGLETLEENPITNRQKSSSHTKADEFVLEDSPPDRSSLKTTKADASVSVETLGERARPSRVPEKISRLFIQCHGLTNPTFFIIPNEIYKNITVNECGVVGRGKPIYSQLKGWLSIYSGLPLEIICKLFDTPDRNEDLCNRLYQKGKNNEYMGLTRLKEKFMPLAGAATSSATTTESGAIDALKTPSDSAATAESGAIDAVKTSSDSTEAIDKSSECYKYVCIDIANR